MNTWPYAVTTLAGAAGVSGTADGIGSAARFYLVRGIDTDGTNLYVTEGYNHTIRKIVIGTGEVTTLAGAAGIPGTADGTGSAARFNFPWGVTTDGTNLYVTDTENFTIRKIIGNADWTEVVAGAGHSLALKSDGYPVGLGRELLWPARGRDIRHQRIPPYGSGRTPTGLWWPRDNTTR